MWPFYYNCHWSLYQIIIESVNFRRHFRQPSAYIICIHCVFDEKSCIYWRTKTEYTQLFLFSTSHTNTLAWVFSSVDISLCSFSLAKLQSSRYMHLNAYKNFADKAAGGWGVGCIMGRKHLLCEKKLVKIPIPAIWSDIHYSWIPLIHSLLPAWKYVFKTR